MLLLYRVSYGGRSAQGAGSDRCTTSVVKLTGRVAALLALQYNLFFFVAELSEPQRKISLAEAIFLTILLALCIVAFVIRRLHEERRDVARQVTTKTQLRQFRWRASRDSLTNLANRRSMLKALAAVTASSRSDGRRHAFLLIDLNNFKRVNDLQGHALGDRVLQVIARRLRSSVRPTDLLARLTAKGDNSTLEAARSTAASDWCASVASPLPRFDRFQAPMRESRDRGRKGSARGLSSEQ